METFPGSNNTDKIETQGDLFEHVEVNCPLEPEVTENDTDENLSKGIEALTKYNNNEKDIYRLNGPEVKALQGYLQSDNCTLGDTDKERILQEITSRIAQERLEDQEDNPYSR